MASVTVPTAKCGPARMRTDLVVLHSTESSHVAGTALAVARWLASTAGPRASVHYVVDVRDVVACVPEDRICWGAGHEANARGVHIEHCGRALSTGWAEEALETLRLSAAVVQGICERWSIPLVALDWRQVRAGERGITTHESVTLAWRQSNHRDPGGPGDERWPWETYLALVMGEPVGRWP